ncbi:hypothetical protein R5L37_01210 [Acinetobacter pittii]|uniref:hypothetical protein n=1 Tax=Acinetobacter pittii TaxID=48296 RepID=UPI0029530F9A|nr:hypothetical protein [Acinetobacter pittii]MDV8150384.1 hypothetical protein [Acinetobacter pittii]
MYSNIHVCINGQNITNSAILEWEKRRARLVLKKLGLSPKSKDLLELRELLLKRKSELGQNKIKALLKKELIISDFFAKLIARLSFGYRRLSSIEIFVENARAEQFVEWFEKCTNQNNEQAMLAGTPDHYLISTNNGAQEVIETNGGSPLVAHFYIDYNELSSLRSRVDLSFPLQIAGVARSKDGFAIGGVRHQFRNEEKGFRAKLTVEYPLLILPTVISGHQWHLANEFSNWISAAFGWSFNR